MVKFFVNHLYKHLPFGSDLKKKINTKCKHVNLKFSNPGGCGFFCSKNLKILTLTARSKNFEK